MAQHREIISGSLVLSLRKMCNSLIKKCKEGTLFPGNTTNTHLHQGTRDIILPVKGEASDTTAAGTLPKTEASSSVAGDECVAALSSSSQCCEYVTAGMSEEQIWAAIQTSREQGWSELKDTVHDIGAAASSCHAQDTVVIWEELKRSNPHLFRDVIADVFDVKLGRVIAEGGQAHIYEASVHIGYVEHAMVAKVFKVEGFSLADLQRQWPVATKNPYVGRHFALGGVVFGEHMLYCSHINWGTFLKDGRFAFVMKRFWGDLRTLINLKLKENNFQGPCFSHRQALNIMWCISKGVGDLHGRGVLHRDLKAANVLIIRKPKGDDHDETYIVDVADFESAMFVQGTGFWRAPEVLEELQKQPGDRNANIWTEKVDAYSFAMTCYEILTGHIPFDGYDRGDWKRVVSGERPHLPDYIDSEVQELVKRCWHKEPSKRPTFEGIHAELYELYINRFGV